MDVPPSRYKVVEQGRRLVVIDTWRGNAPVTGHAARADVPARPATVEQARAALRTARPARGAAPAAAGGMDTPAWVVTTRAWFDDKAPRRIRIESRDQSKIGIVAAVTLAALLLLFAMFGWPAWLVVAIILAQKAVRKGLRALIAPMLDGLEGG